MRLTAIFVFALFATLVQAHTLTIGDIPVQRRGNTFTVTVTADGLGNPYVCRDMRCVHKFSIGQIQLGRKTAQRTIYKNGKYTHILTFAFTVPTDARLDNNRIYVELVDSPMHTAEKRVPIGP